MGARAGRALAAVLLALDVAVAGLVMAGLGAGAITVRVVGRMVP